VPGELRAWRPADDAGVAELEGVAVTNLEAADALIASLLGMKPVDEARAELVRTLAGALDAGAGMATAAVAREYRAAISELVGDSADDDDAALEAALSLAE
jgi:hypothetical protein